MATKPKKTKAADPEPLVVTSQANVVLATYRYDVVESLRYIVSRLTRYEALPRRLSLLATLRQEGVTYLSQGLGATLAHDLQATVCAVELNWWWPSTLPVGPQAGLASVLSGKASLEDALVWTHDPCLAWLPAGDLDPSQRSQFAHSKALAATLAELNRRFDYLILDVPAMRATSDALPLASLGAAGCLVVSQDGASVDTAQQTVDEVAPLPMLGVIMNRVQLQTPKFLLKVIPEA